MKHLVDKTAFVTGGGSGIGLSIVRSLVAAGARVVIADWRQDHLDSALESFADEQRARRIHAVRVDVSDRSWMSEVAQEAERVFGRIHVLVNNAGVGIEGPFSRATYADWDFGLGVNLGGVINGLQTFLPRIRAHGEGGHIVNTASLAALVVMPSHLAIYAAAKAAVLALTESIRADLAAENIGTTALCPGPVRSNIHELELNRPPRYEASAAFQEAAQQLHQRVPSSLWMDPAEVASMTVRAIRNNEPYVITHGEWRPAFMERTERILAHTPPSTNPDLIQSLRRPHTG